MAYSIKNAPIYRHLKVTFALPCLYLSALFAATLQASGEARYASDLPAGVRQPLWACFVFATKSQVQYDGLDESAALKMAGVVRVLNSSHVPGSNRVPGFKLFLEPVRFLCNAFI